MASSCRLCVTFAGLLSLLLLGTTAVEAFLCPSRSRCCHSLVVSTSTGTTRTAIDSSSFFGDASKQQHRGGLGLGTKRDNRVLFMKINKARREQLGIADDEEEYDLGVALNNNTDPLISKIVAGSLIVVIIGLLVAGVVIPYTTDYGEGVCNALLNQGRC